MRYRLDISVKETDDDGEERYLFELTNDQDYLQQIVNMMYGGVKLFASNQYIATPAGDPEKEDGE